MSFKIYPFEKRKNMFLKDLSRLTNRYGIEIYGFDGLGVQLLDVPKDIDSGGHYEEYANCNLIFTIK